MSDRGRTTALRTALAVVSMRDALGREPSAMELMERLGMERRTAYRWAASLREVLAERRPIERPPIERPRLFPHIERVSA